MLECVLQVKSARSSWVRVKKSKVDEVRDILANVVLAHVPVRQFDFRTKMVYISVMIRRMLHVRLPTPHSLNYRSYHHSPD